MENTTGIARYSDEGIMSDELVQLLIFLEEQFYMQWKMDNYPHPVYPFLDGSYQPQRADTSEFLKSLIEKASEITGSWEGYNPSEMEDFIGEWRATRGFETLSSLEEEASKRNVSILTVGI